MRISDWSSYVCSSDRDRVGGDAVALGINGTATAQNDATVTNAMGAALAGNDIILSEDGNDVLAGDALASGLGGTATADNIAAVVGSGDGDINFLAPLVPGLPSDLDRKSTRLNSSHYCAPRMPSSA